MAAKSAFTNDQKRDYAKTVFLTEKTITKKALAARVGVTEKTIASWIEAGKWDSLRTSLVMSKKDIMARLYIILDNVASDIESCKNGWGDNKMADSMIKYTAAVKNLETETNVAEIVDVCTQLVDFMKTNYPELHEALIDPIDAFVMSKLK